MKKSVLAALSVSTILSAAASAGLPGISPRIDDRVMVRLVNGAMVSEFAAAWNEDHPDAMITPIDQVAGRPIHLFHIDLPEGYTELYMEQLEIDLETGYPEFIDVFTEEDGDDPEPMAEFLYENEAPEGHTGATYVDGLDGVQFHGQYLRDQLGLADAHTRTTGVGTVVAVLDTGVDASHAALADKVLPFGWDFVDGDAIPDEVANGVDDDGDGTADDMYGHGTFVAGLITLVAPDARVLPVRVLDDEGVGDSWRLVQGMYHAIDFGVEAINVSLGSTYPSTVLEQAIVDAGAFGIPVFAAAGNLDRSEPRERPAMDQAYGVAALDEAGVKADFSNFSRRLFISGPGTSGIVGPIAGSDDGYGTWEGTSFSTPLATGAALLLRSQLLDHPANFAVRLTMQLHLASSAQNIYGQNPEHAAEMELGWGRLDASGATQFNEAGPTVLGDLDLDGDVGFVDLLILLSDWEATYSHADLNGDNVVGFTDLLWLLGNWG